MLKLLVILLFSFTSLSSFAQYNIKRLMEEGRHSLDNGYYVVSLQIFDRIVALKPYLYEAWYLMALSKYHLEDFKGAEYDCRQALYLQPYIADIYDLYGMVCIREEKFDSAAVAYTKALDLEQNNQEFWYNRAYCFYMNGKNKEALTQLALMRKQWENFEPAKQLEDEIKNGKKPKRNYKVKSKLNILKLNLPDKGSWPMKRMSNEGKSLENKQRTEMRLNK